MRMLIWMVRTATFEIMVALGVSIVFVWGDTTSRADASVF